MNKHWLTTGSVVTLATLLSACASAPKESPALEEAKASYVAAMDNTDVARNGLTQLRKAEEHLERAERLLEEGGNEEAMGHEIYLANRHLAIAREKAVHADLNAELAKAERRRDELRIRLGERRAQIAEMEARMLREQMDRLQAEQTDRGMVMTLGDVLFDVDKAELKPDGERTVQKLTEFMKEYENYRVRVEGYTDSTGEAAYNQELSLRRADAVKDELVADGIAPSRVETKGFGEQYPEATNATAAGRQENRRVEIVISDREGNIGSR